MNKLDAITVGVMEIGMTARKRTVPFLRIFNKINPTGLQDFEAAVKLILFDDKGMMMRIFIWVVRVHMMRNFR